MPNPVVETKQYRRTNVHLTQRGKLWGYTFLCRKTYVVLPIYSSKTAAFRAAKLHIAEVYRQQRD